MNTEYVYNSIVETQIEIEKIIKNKKIDINKLKKLSTKLTLSAYEVNNYK